MREVDISERYGKASWVFLTGAANGIGLEYAWYFARRGFNIIAIDIDKQGLEKAKSSIQESFTVEVYAKTVDLTKLSTIEDYKRIVKEVKDKDISIVVNNAGI
jgi:short-subunit dehydrogenase